MIKRLFVLFAICTCLFACSGTSYAYEGESIEECFDRVVYQNSWICQEPNPGAVIPPENMPKLIRNVHITSCDVQSENMTFTCNTQTLSNLHGEIIKGHMMIIYNAKGEWVIKMVRWG